MKVLRAGQEIINETCVAMRWSSSMPLYKGTQKIEVILEEKELPKFIELLKEELNDGIPRNITWKVPRSIDLTWILSIFLEDYYPSTEFYWRIGRVCEINKVSKNSLQLICEAEPWK